MTVVDISAYIGRYIGTYGNNYIGHNYMVDTSTGYISTMMVDSREIQPNRGRVLNKNWSGINISLAGRALVDRRVAVINRSGSVINRSGSVINRSGSGLAYGSMLVWRPVADHADRLHQNISAPKYLGTSRQRSAEGGLAPNLKGHRL